MAKRVDLFQVTLAAIVVVSLLMWSVYAVTYLSPNDEASTINTALNRATFWASNISGNATIVKPSEEAQFIIEIQKTVPGGQGPSSWGLPGHLGFGMGPVPRIPSNSSFSEYVIFEFVCSCLYANPRLTGPQGNITQFMAMSDPPGTRVTMMASDDSPGNYTLHYTAPQNSNETLRVALTVSGVVFSRPYLYPGLASTIIAVSFTLGTGLKWKKTMPRSEPNKKAAEAEQ